jgi:hypothetical protein
MRKVQQVENIVAFSVHGVVGAMSADTRRTKWHAINEAQQWVITKLAELKGKVSRIPGFVNSAAFEQAKVTLESKFHVTLKWKGDASRTSLDRKPAVKLTSGVRVVANQAAMAHTDKDHLVWLIPGEAPSNPIELHKYCAQKIETLRKSRGMPATVIFPLVHCASVQGFPELRGMSKGSDIVVKANQESSFSLTEQGVEVAVKTEMVLMRGCMGAPRTFEIHRPFTVALVQNDGDDPYFVAAIE